MSSSTRFKSWERGFFRQRPDGDWDFFPFGRFGFGYRIDAAKKAELSQSMLRFQIVLTACFVIVIPASFAILRIASDAEAGDTRSMLRSGGLHLAMFLAFCALGLVLQYWYVRSRVRNLPPAEGRLDAREEYQLWASKVPRLAMALVLLVGPIGFLGILFGVWSTFMKGDWGGVLFLVFVAVLWGATTWYYVQAWRYSSRR